MCSIMYLLIREYPLPNLKEITMPATITKKPAITVEVKRETLEALMEKHEVATRMCDGEEGYLDVSVFDLDVAIEIAKLLDVETGDIQGNLLVLDVID
jgi:hypothetical protein